MRVRDLAKELSVSNQEVLSILKEHGVEVTNHMSQIDSSLVAMVKDSLQGKEAGESASSDTSVKRVGAKVIRRRKVKKSEDDESEAANSDDETASDDEVQESAEDEEVLAPVAMRVVKRKAADGEDRDATNDESVNAEAAQQVESIDKTAAGGQQPVETVVDPVDSTTENALVADLGDGKGGARIVGQRIKLEEPAAPRRARPSVRPGAANRTMPDPLLDPESEKRKKGAPGKKERVIKHPKRRVVTKTDKYRHILTEGTSNLRGSATRKKKKGEKLGSTAPMSAAKKKIRIAESIQVGELAKQMGVKSSDIVKKFMELGTVVTVNQSIDPETAGIIAADYEFEIEITLKTEEQMLTTVEDHAEDMIPRPPVVTVMGHVDHGKTSILDVIRKARVVEGEAGGITQHIGAYQITRNDKIITFIDTPGHAAFSAMRSRGASVTDIVVLVVAADDGVMPQTIEAIKHAQNAEVPIIVAINKMDVPGANPDRVTQQLSEHGIMPESWGGENLFVQVSARTGEGIGELLETILLQAEMLAPSANPKRDFSGVVLESSLDKGKGPLVTVLVNQGTLKQGDVVLVDTFFGRVRVITDDQGNRHKEATPGTPVSVQGLNGVPSAGDVIVSVKNEKTAREIADRRHLKDRETVNAKRTKMTLEELFSQAGSEAGVAQVIPLVIKSDVQGSAEAIVNSLEALSTDECRVAVIADGVGAISESDVNLAATSRAAIIGFNVRADSKSSRLATQQGVEIRFYDIIYNVIDDVRQAMLGTLAPTEKEESLGWAKVKEIFPISGIGTIAGCIVESGKVLRGCGVRLVRSGKTVYDGKLDNLKRFKDDAKEVQAGQECGMLLNNHNDVLIGDELELYQILKVERTEL